MNLGDRKLERVRDFMKTDPQTDLPDSEPVTSGTVLGGQRLGPYGLRAKLGEGGMGVVYRAKDERLGREVALKMLKVPPGAGTALVERFRREERNAARLKHPSIITLYEIGQDGDALYYTMELIEGGPFDVREGGLERRVGILAKAARAVQYAHEQSVVHRDLKPANILVDAQGEPHILDFGLSMDLEAPGELTRPGHFFGTPVYMSPEQADGRVREVGPRSDVYALGVILYEILAGRVPFQSESNVELIRRIVTEEPSRPPGPADLVAIVLKALDKDPANRYATSGALADDLERFLNGEPIEARPVSDATRLWRRLAKHRVLLLMVALALILGAGVGIAVSRQGGGEAPLPVADALAQLSPFGEGADSDEVGGTGGTPFADAPIPPALLTGLRFTAFPPEAPRNIQSVQPLYQAESGLRSGALLGDRGHAPTDLVAKSGYAVGGLVVRSTIRVTAFRIIFMRIDGGRLNPQDRYESEWVGGPAGAERVLQSANGEAVVGLFGRAGADIDALGLIFLRR